MDLRRIFTEHPASVGETYGQHLTRAWCFGSRMVLAGLACMLHSLLPFTFVRTGSQAVEELNSQMQATKHRSATSSLRAPVMHGGHLPS